LNYAKERALSRNYWDREVKKMKLIPSRIKKQNGFSNIYFNFIKRYLLKQLSICFLVFLFTVFSSVCTVSAQQQFKWVRGGGSNEVMPSGYTEESVQFICTDPNGNIYALSIVGGSSPSIPVYADTFYKATGAYGSPNNALLTSYTCSGIMRWAKLIASTDQTIINGITADNQGHIYVAGHFQHAGGTNTFYIGYDTSITGFRNLAEGLIQFDTNGHYNWVRFIGNNTLSSFAAINPEYAPLAIDGTNNVHFYPYMKSGVPLMTGVTSHYGVYDMTYDPYGNLLSAVRLDLDSQWYLKGAVIDPVTNKLYVAGDINIGIYGGYLTDTNFAAAFDVSRHSIWWHYPGHGTNDNFLSGVTLDQQKRLHFSGGTQSLYYTFNGDSVISSHYTGDMGIILTTDTNGHPLWIKNFDGSLSVNYLTGITQLPNGKVAAIGSFAGKVTDGSGTVTITTPAIEGQNPYLVIVDSAGDLQMMEQIHGDGFYDEGYAITSDKTGNVYVGGQVEDSIWASTPKIPAYHTRGGGTDFFIMKYGVDCSCTSMPTSLFTHSGTHTLSVTYTGTMTGLDSVVWNYCCPGKNNIVASWLATGSY
jgi:hypothetical protein